MYSWFCHSLLPAVELTRWSLRSLSASVAVRPASLPSCPALTCPPSSGSSASSPASSRVMWWSTWWDWCSRAPRPSGPSPGPRPSSTRSSFSSTWGWMKTAGRPLRFGFLGRITAGGVLGLLETLAGHPNTTRAGAGAGRLIESVFTVFEISIYDFVLSVLNTEYVLFADKTRESTKKVFTVLSVATCCIAGCWLHSTGINIW